jgi:hypothetical protein
MERGMPQTKQERDVQGWGRGGSANGAKPRADVRHLLWVSLREGGGKGRGLTQEQRERCAEMGVWRAADVAKPGANVRILFRISLIIGEHKGRSCPMK